MISPSTTAPVNRGEGLRARSLADQAFSRAAGAPLISGNTVRLLRDAAENYPAWLVAIAAARHHVHFENYILADDPVGVKFADALIEKARTGVQVRLIYDWLGVRGKSSRAYWTRLREGGVDVRCFNPPKLESPLGWVSRDHRKLLTVDGEVAFVSGLCVAQMWLGDPARNVEPWRDTGVELRGPAVVELEEAFAASWRLTGPPLPREALSVDDSIAATGNVNVRIVASDPATSGTFRLDQLVVAFARQRVWLTDAYYVGAPTYVQALITAARDGVDVRMLLPRSTDIPLVKMLSRAGYRTLLDAGVRVFEWNGSLLHAKTAVVDSRWSRVGSTNLNLASWMGNCELDAVIEDEPFAQEMEKMYLDDLSKATEVVLKAKKKVRASHPPEHRSPSGKHSGKAGRAAAGAARIGNALGAALTNRRVIESVETRMLATMGLVLLALAVVCAIFPRVLAYPIALLLLWVSLALIYRSIRVRKKSG